MSLISAVDVPRGGPSGARALAADPFPELVLGRFVVSLHPLMRWVSGAVAMVVFGAFLYLSFARFDYALPFGMIAGSAWIVMAATLRGNRGGLPIVSMLALQHMAVYGLPLVVENPAIERYSPECLMAGSRAFVLFAVALGLGWRAGVQRRPAAPSKYFLTGARTSRALSKHVGRLGLGFLATGLGFQVVQSTGLYWSLLGNLGARFFSIYQAIGLIACTAGAFLGAFASKRDRATANLYWLLWASTFLLLISGVLLSGATGLVMATIAGLFMGGQRVPWIAVAAIVAVISFLNLGKFDIRARYWGNEATQGAAVTLRGLPAFYGEWIAASYSKLTARSAPVSMDDDTGQSMADRINNLQNLLFITEALVVESRPTLNGQGYRLLPSVFVPRMIWAGKPRTHEGMVLLNVHYGRQRSVEETEKTYIAWGLLPEAIGNLGMWLGPLLLGLAMGWSCGWIETWSARKNLLSIEGLGASMLMVSAAVSFEMAMGVLLAMLFQSAVAIVIGGMAFRAVAGR